MSSDLVIAIVIASALAFGFTNGFHDTSDLVGTAVSTGAARPQVAIALAAVLNFAGAFISVEVAADHRNGHRRRRVDHPAVVFAGLIGAIAWNLATWWLGLPSSSSHALIGGVVGGDARRGGHRAVSMAAGCSTSS